MHHGQLIGIEPVASTDHEVADLAAQVLAVLALHAVGEVVFQFRDAQADCGVFAGMTGVAAQAWINPVIRRQFFPRAGAGVGQAVVEQLIQHLRIGVVTVALADHFAVPFETVAFQCLEDRRLGAGLLPGRVKVFHAQ